MGSKHGRFEMTYPSGDKYRGDFRNGMRYGQGVYVSAAGHRYEGSWMDDLRHGSGIATFVEPDPKGGTKWAGTYEGQWIKNLKHGKGIFSYANGDKYEGQWVKGKKNGFGIYRYANGDRYEGEFKEDDMHGKGVLTLANGDQLSGTWEKDQGHGKMIFINATTKQKFEEIWENGNRVSSVKIEDNVTIPSAAVAAPAPKPDDAGEVDDLMKEIIRQRTASRVLPAETAAAKELADTAASTAQAAQSSPRGNEVTAEPEQPAEEEAAPAEAVAQTEDS